MLILSGIIITVFYNILKPEKVLPIYQPADINFELVDENIQYQRKYHTISDFELTNQEGETVSQEDYANKIYVADFFFTTCQTICPIMTKNMGVIQNELLNDDEVLLLSHTVTPEIDDVNRLKQYAQEKGVRSSKWNLVTGSKAQIYNLARKSYLVAKEDPMAEDFGLVHTENFVLVDKERRIRGIYDGTDPSDIERLLEDIEVLKKEYH